MTSLSPIPATASDGTLPELPPGWEWTTLGTISEIIGGVTKGRNLGGKQTVTLPYLRVANVQRGFIDLEEVKQIELLEVETEKYRLRDNDIVLTEGGDWDKLGRAAIWKSQLPLCIHQNHIFRARMYNRELSVEWFVYYVNSENGQAYFRGAAKQTTNLASINLTQLKACPIPLPPLAEQRRIVEAIETELTRLDAGVASLRAAQTKLGRYRASVLKAACEGRLVEQDPSDEPASALLQRILAERRERWAADLRAKGKDPAKAQYAAPAAPDAEGLPALPVGWVWATVEQVASSIVDCLHTTPRFTDDGGYCIDTNSMNYGSIAFERARFVSTETFEERVRRLRPIAGDLLFAREGTIGTAALVPENVKLCLGQRMMMFRPDECIVPGYFLWSVLSPFFEAQWKPRVSGSTSPHVNIGDLRQMILPLPPLAEQRRIVAEVERRLSVVAAMEAAVAANLRRAERLRQAILKRAFEGRLVPQDPSDEPASVLLERIRAARQAGVAATSKGRHGRPHTVDSVAQATNGASKRRGRPRKEAAQPTGRALPASEPVREAEQLGLEGLAGG